jgi:hypothetical protein
MQALYLRPSISRKHLTSLTMFQSPEQAHQIYQKDHYSLSNQQAEDSILG